MGIMIPKIVDRWEKTLKERSWDNVTKINNDTGIKAFDNDRSITLTYEELITTDKLEAVLGNEHITTKSKGSDDWHRDYVFVNFYNLDYEATGTRTANPIYTINYYSLNQATDQELEKLKTKAIKIAHKRFPQLDVLSKVKQQLLANTYTYNRFTLLIDGLNRPIQQGDLALVQAFGRLRNVVVVGTTGKSIVVAYVTPSNPFEYKLKTVPVDHLYLNKDYPVDQLKPLLQQTQLVAP